MQVRALVSFVDMEHGGREAGKVFALPEGADWLRAGLVEVVAEPEAEPTAEPDVPAPSKPGRKKKG